MRLKDLIGWVIFAFIGVCHPPLGVVLALAAFFYSASDKEDEKK